METTRNRSAILAQFLRASVAVVRKCDSEGVDRQEYVEALASIDAVADELEAVAAASLRQHVNDGESCGRGYCNCNPAHSSEPRDLNTSVEVHRQDPVKRDKNRVGEREPSNENADGR